MGTANGRKSIFVTGAASGMGRETARLFRHKGWFIGAYDVNLEGLRALEKELGAENCLMRRLDVTDKADYEGAIAQFGGATDGKLDILITMPALAWAATSMRLRSSRACAW
jgi:NADP-dependent 3-hydroxy acid dehydrogenase YdfG